MKRGLLISAWIAMLGAATAQWLHYPTEGVPKTPEGKPNFEAPAPRLADGKPDFSGIWHTAVINQCQPETGLFCGNTEIGGSPLALDIGRDLQGGLPYQPWAAAAVKQRFSKDDPHVRCLPDNPPRTWVMPHLSKIVHTPKLMVLLYEVNAMYRQIFIDGRPLPEDPNPSWNGYSTAAWEDDTLVIRTNGFRDDLWIDMLGAPMTSAATITERLRRPSFGSLQVSVTIDDPKTYTRPWSVSMNQELMLENEKSWQHMQIPEAKK